MAEKKQLTERQQALLNHLAGEAQGDIRTAMRMAGYSDSTSIQEAVKPIKDEIIETTTMMVATSSPKAASKLISVLDNPAELGAKNIVAAAKELLDRAGVVKTEKVEVDSKQGGMFILPPKKAEE